MPFGCVSCADTALTKTYTTWAKMVFNAFRLCVLCGPVPPLRRFRPKSTSLQCLSAVCPVRTGRPADFMPPVSVPVFNAFRLCVLCGPTRNSRTMSLSRPCLQCLSAVCPVRTTRTTPSRPRSPSRVFNAFRLCVLCGRLVKSRGFHYFPWCLQCLSAVCPVRTIIQQVGNHLPEIEVFNAFRLCVLCGRNHLPEIEDEAMWSSMPFGCVSCADTWKCWKTRISTWLGLQCLSAVCPVRTEKSTFRKGGAERLSSMPFGCVSCADGTRGVDRPRCRRLVFNAFRLCVLCGRGD